MSVLDKLLILQERDNRILQLQREIEDIPKRKQIEEDRLEEHRANVVASEEKLQAMQVKIKELDLEGETHKEKITKLRQQQLELKTNKEFKAVESEVATLQNAIGELEDRELGLLTEADDIRDDLETRKAELAREDESVKQDVAAWDARASSLEGELVEAKTERDAAVGEVDDEELLSNYQRVHSRREDAIVQLNDGFCGGCHMKVPPSVVHAVKRHDGDVHCDFCARLLYAG